MAAVARLRAQAVDPADHPLVEVRIDAHGVEHLRAVLEQPGQDVVDVVDREGIVGAVVAGGALGPGALAVPGLALRVAIAHEQDVFGLLAARHQHGDRLRLAEAGQVVKVAVLAIGVLDVVVALPHRRRRQDRDGVAPHQAHQLAAAAREFFTADYLGFGQQFGGAAGACARARRRAGCADFLAYVACQCNRPSCGLDSPRRGSSSSNTSCTPTRTNSTSSE